MHLQIKHEFADSSGSLFCEIEYVEINSTFKYLTFSDQQLKTRITETLFLNCRKTVWKCKNTGLNYRKTDMNVYMLRF